MTCVSCTRLHVTGCASFVTLHVTPFQCSFTSHSALCSFFSLLCCLSPISLCLRCSHEVSRTYESGACLGVRHKVCTFVSGVSGACNSYVKSAYNFTVVNTLCCSAVERPAAYTSICRSLQGGHDPECLIRSVLVSSNTKNSIALLSIPTDMIQLCSYMTWRQL